MKEGNLANRMKYNYEQAFNYRVPLRMPVVVRIDGRAFHTFTKGFGKPFDGKLITNMQMVATRVLKEASHSVLAYGQSDEISFLFNNYEELETQMWLGGEIQKLASITAGIASACMTRAYPEKDLAVFDSRVFVLPQAEVNNYFVWRQQDAERNSLSMLCQSLYSHKELIGKKRAEQHDLLFAKGQNWNDLATYKKRGWCIKKFPNGSYLVDQDIPIFKDNKTYINELVYPLMTISDEETDRA